ncbi:hypothetical protein POM88_045144 [Heracleum sosnowskyi]|uniref:Uncharacterized protein n=1 Tax=Heracleum sosnowskyi TaxID=360622 RepID=A0AAD8H6U4_9APIA|nr:hypothetical protein POM88_045144 [Heracleum sosnowskyi]
MSYSDYHSFRFKLNRTMIVQRRYNKVYSEQFPGPTLYMAQRETQLLSEPQAIENTRNKADRGPNRCLNQNHIHPFMKDIELLTRIPIESIISEIGQVLVMTPQILLNALRHSFVKLETIKILLFDECHHARGRHPYACIMTEFFHRQVEPNNLQLPRILGMTASPINTKEYTAGSNTCFSLQSMMVQNKIVEEFRTGTVNVIVATSVLEEGLHVQSCNLVVRFDTSATVCSFIQSRGRARMQNSEFLLLVKVATILHLRD